MKRRKKRKMSKSAMLACIIGEPNSHLSSRQATNETSQTMLVMVH